MKKLGIVTAAAAGLLMLGGPAFADPDVVNGAAPQIGLVNIQGVGIANDWNINVGAFVCGISAGVPVLSPVPFDDCGDTAGIFDD
nr:hypothetical protein [Kibdelosporangium sp. MJ126-NF4]CEL19100.1 hypothetical protein [Kibdelosporangium sp. MJ126-NF4]CTQ95098.1 hypothetical protein [Kibdelosporangium sp. MJ126-NF4]